jgi:hypothetical protein
LQEPPKFTQIEIFGLKINRLANPQQTSMPWQIIITTNEAEEKRGRQASVTGLGEFSPFGRVFKLANLFFIITKELNKFLALFSENNFRVAMNKKCAGGHLGRFLRRSIRSPCRPLSVYKRLVVKLSFIARPTGFCSYKPFIMTESSVTRDRCFDFLNIFAQTTASFC